jgi:hypothetical protein
MKVSYKELIFIGYGGLIRGAIAFGLVLHIDPSGIAKETIEVFKTTTLALVIITTVIFGSFMPLV